MKIIKLMAGVLGMAVSVSSMAVGFSSVNNPLSGDLPDGSATTTQLGGIAREQHWVQSFTSPGTCNGVCQEAELQESEILIQLNVTNQSGCDPSGPAVATGTRQCIQTPATADYYTGNSDGGGSNYTGSGMPADPAGEIPTVSHLQIFAPFCSTPGAGCFTYVDLGATGAALFAMLDWDFITNKAGRIIEGHAVGSANVAGTNIVGMFDITDRLFTTYYGPDAEAQTKIDCLVDTPLDCGNFTTFFFSRSDEFEYVTAGMAQLDLSKAVPVPTFAAAALGLGLVGITFLTGRRRQIKQAF